MVIRARSLYGAALTALSAAVTTGLLNGCQTLGGSKECLATAPPNDTAARLANGDITVFQGTNFECDRFVGPHWRTDFAGHTTPATKRYDEFSCYAHNGGAETTHGAPSLITYSLGYAFKKDSLFHSLLSSRVSFRFDGRIVEATTLEDNERVSYQKTLSGQPHFFNFYEADGPSYSQMTCTGFFTPDYRCEGSKWFVDRAERLLSMASQGLLTALKDSRLKEPLTEEVEPR